MIEKMNMHYSMTNPASIYDEEALTALELVGRTTAKVNECIEHVNAQDEDIHNQKEVVIPETIKNEVQNQINNGTFDSAIDKYAGNLETRLDNLMGAVTEGSTTMDAEIIDARVTYDNVTNTSLGGAVRRTGLSVFDMGFISFRLMNSFHVDTVAKVIRITSPFYISHLNNRVDVAEAVTEINYSEVPSNIFYLAINPVTKEISCVVTANWTRNGLIPFMVINHSALNLYQYGVTPFIGAIKVNNLSINITTEPYTGNGFGMTFHTDPYPPVRIDSVNKTIDIVSELYCCYASKRYNVMPATLSYADVGDSTIYLVVLVTETDATSYTPCAIIGKGDFNPTRHCIMAQFQTNHLNRVMSSNCPFPYIVDGVTLNDYPENYASSSAEGLTLYVDAENGSDSNVGSKANPLKTINQAISKGGNVIYCKAGEYYQSLTIENKHGIRIIAGWETLATGVERPKVILTSSAKELIPKGDTIKTIAYASTSNDLIHKVFVAKTIDAIVEGSRSDSYTVTLWNVTDSKKKNHAKLKPVLTLAECQTEENTFFYDGTTLHIHSTGAKFRLTDNAKNCRIINSSNIVFEDVNFDYFYSDCLNVTDSNSVIFRNCEFNHSSTANGLATYNVNGEIYNCEAWHNRNDGFNLHGYGETTIFNCIGAYNYDDGISHHDGCTGSIHGGQWFNNNKGGISSPTHSCLIDIYNAVTHHNGYGIYAVSGLDETDKRDVIVSNCYIHNNGVGIISSYNIVGVNNVMKDNTTETEGSGTVTLV